jgi:Trypsin
MQLANRGSFPLRMIIVSGIVFAGIPCAAAIIRHDRKAADYIKVGEEKAFRCAGKAGVKPLGKAASFHGGAVLVSPQWVLTAGHIAARIELERLRFQFGDQQYRAVRVVHHPDFTPRWMENKESRIASLAAGADLALVELEKPVAEIAPAVRYRGDDEVGKIVTVVGEGCIGDGKAGIGVPPVLERRGGHNVIDSAGGKLGEIVLSDRVLMFDFDDPNDESRNQLGSPMPLELEVSIAQGDSGGGWFIDEGGAWKLVAITSGRLPPTGDLAIDDDGRLDVYYGALAQGMRVSRTNDWIDKVIGAGSKGGDPLDPAVERQNAPQRSPLPNLTPPPSCASPGNPVTVHPSQESTSSRHAVSAPFESDHGLATLRVASRELRVALAYLGFESLQFHDVHFVRFRLTATPARGHILVAIIENGTSQVSIDIEHFGHAGENPPGLECSSANATAVGPLIFENVVTAIPPHGGPESAHFRFFDIWHPRRKQKTQAEAPDKKQPSGLGHCSSSQIPRERTSRGSGVLNFDQSSGAGPGVRPGRFANPIQIREYSLATPYFSSASHAASAIMA